MLPVIRLHPSQHLVVNLLHLIFAAVDCLISLISVRLYQSGSTSFTVSSTTSPLHKAITHSDRQWSPSGCIFRQEQLCRYIPISPPLCSSIACRALCWGRTLDIRLRAFVRLLHELHELEPGVCGALCSFQYERRCERMCRMCGVTSKLYNDYSCRVTVTRFILCLAQLISHRPRGEAQFDPVLALQSLLCSQSFQYRWHSLHSLSLTLSLLPLDSFLIGKDWAGKLFCCAAIT